MRSLVLLATAAVGTLLAPGVGHASEVSTLVVDDDLAQCAQAQYRTIGEAVTAAGPGDRVRVCAGSYEERVTVSKSLVIEGQPDEVEAIDCFATAASVRGDLDTAVYPVLSPPDGNPDPLLQLQADGVEVSGLVLEGQHDLGTLVGNGPATIFRAALETSPLHSGYRIHHNLLRLNTLGMDAPTSGVVPSRYDHNCLRENRWGVASQMSPLQDARLDHNETFGNSIIAFEMGWQLAGVSDLRLDHNVSRRDGFAWSFDNATDVVLEDNVIEAIQRGVTLGDGTARVAITRNSITGGTVGILFRGAPLGAPLNRTVGVAVQDNTISAMAGTPGTGLFIASTHRPEELTVRDNILSDNGASGLRVAGGSGNTYANNVMERNGSFGAFVGTSAIENTFAGNVMLDNGIADAQDATAYVEDGVTKVRNEWIDNVCVIDVPMGFICEGPELP